MKPSKRVIVYIEGEGGGSRSGERHYLDGEFRKSWRSFLDPLAGTAERGGATFKVVAGHGRGQCYGLFAKPMHSDRDALRLLVVDAEGPVADVGKPWDSLPWKTPPGLSERHCYVIVQCVETWLIADLEAIARYYNRSRECFDKSKIPAWRDLEHISKVKVQSAIIPPRIWTGA